jgi:hypothetical protein
MRAVCEIYTESEKKTVTKEGKDRKALEWWLLNMTDNPQPVIGWLEDGTFAVTTGWRDYERPSG